MLWIDAQTRDKFTQGCGPVFMFLIFDSWDDMVAWYVSQFLRRKETKSDG